MAKNGDELLPTRASLLIRLKNLEDNSSWEDFFNTYWKLIYGVSRKAGLMDCEAQDVVQETMASVARHLPNFQYDPAIGSFKAWLLTKTRWCIIGLLRKRVPLAADQRLNQETGGGTDFIETLIDPTSADLDRYWETEWEKNLLSVATAHVKRRLDPHKYQLFDCYVNLEWPAEKVAEEYGVSIEQVYQAKHRVTEAIKEEAQRLDGDRM